MSAESTAGRGIGIFVALAVTLYPAALLALYIPFDVAIRNVNDFPAESDFFVLIAAGFSISWLAPAGLLYLAFRSNSAPWRRAGKLILALAFGACIWSAAADASELLQLSHTASLEVLALVLAAWLVFYVDFAKAAPYLGAMGAGAVLLTAQYVYSGDFFPTRESNLSVERPFSSTADLSLQAQHTTRGNVYHIVLDGFQSELFQVAAREGGVVDSLKDFAFFENFITNSWSTHWSMAMMARGSYYESGINWADWDFESFQAGFVDRLQRAGVPISQYVLQPYHCLLRRSYCRHFAEYKSTYATFMLADLWFLNVLPRSLRRVLEDEARAAEDTGGWTTGFSLTERLLGRHKAVVPGHFPVFSLDMLEGVSRDEAMRGARGNYIYAHFIVPHAPLVLDAQCHYDPTQTAEPDEAVIGQHACALRILARLVERLKQLRRYEEALIIVHTDHGHLTPRGFRDFGLMSYAGFEPGIYRFALKKGDIGNVESSYLEATTAGLLLVKLPNSSSAGVSDAAAQLIDVAPTVLNHFGLETRDYPGMPINPESESRGQDRRVQVPNTGSYSIIPEVFAEYALRDGKFAFVRWVQVIGSGEKWRPRFVNHSLVTSHLNYNIVAVNNRLLAIQRGIGSINLTEERLGDRTLWPYILTAGSRKTVEAELRSAVARDGESAPDGIEAYRFVDLPDRSVAFHKDLEPVTIGEEFFGERELSPYVLIGRSVDGLRGRINHLLGDVAAGGPLR